MICSLEKFLPSPLRRGNSLILIWLKMLRGHFKHWQLVPLCFFQVGFFCCPMIVVRAWYTRKVKRCMVDKHRGGQLCKGTGIVRQGRGGCRPYIFLSWQELKLEIKDVTSTAVEQYLLGKQMPKLMLALSSCLKQLPSLQQAHCSFCNRSCHQNHHLYHQRQHNFLSIVSNYHYKQWPKSPTLPSTGQIAQKLHQWPLWQFYLWSPPSSGRRAAQSSRLLHHRNPVEVWGAVRMSWLLGCIPFIFSLWICYEIQLTNAKITMSNISRLSRAIY